MLGIKGYPSVLVPGDFRGGDDDITLASLNMDARLLHGGKILTLEEIRKRVRASCEPFYVASRHEQILKKFNYHEGRSTGNRNEYDIDFDIKEDR